MVGQSRGFRPSEASVEPWIFAEKVAAMRRVDALVADPDGRRRVLGSRQRHGVAVSAGDPFEDASAEVLAEACFVSAPHDDGRMPRPARACSVKSVEDLLGLDPLLAEPKPVERGCGACEVGVREEGLHVSPTPRASRA